MNLNREQKNILFALNTFEQMRSKIISRTLSKDPEIYFGLHSIENHLSEIYLKRNKVSWLLEHFEIYKKNIDSKIQPNDKSYKKECIEYFSRVFKNFLELNGETFTNSEIAIELLKVLEYELDSMINFSENWENSYNQLCAIMAKNKEKYKKLKREMMEV